MRRMIISVFATFVMISAASAYQLVSSKELGRGESKNQNVVVRCTTDTGKVSTATCSLRRYAKCTGTGTNQKCAGWAAWTDLRTPGTQYSDWRSAASACCRAKGLR
ncbi:MAG: hypothetical protein IJ560_04355 [Alphaproteobacteria bacterium]|nr:hypothetical protein [Alphaproteobacteria bacterium]